MTFMTIVALTVSHIVTAAVAYIVGVNRNRAAAKAEIAQAKADLLAAVEKAKK